MKITRQTVADKIAAYLRHEITLAQLVDWAEKAMLDGEMDESDASTIAEVVARLGVADVRAFGLTWEDCEQLLKRLGFAARVEVVVNQPG
jgi:cobyrinic acid a,c-diamide synthase